ncbi:recombinase family protein [Clostridium tertium]|uniref:recombinase family protein n=1 Tax=Clostridium tertium TaxID=1559 RepID=UPI00232CCCA9|nr:recombinase family protein [Clostridium tertium]MDB1955453.1 recombinase family protein [Clostridium tertium]MDB1957228.1 recombinase family protein [Clostridium tertium]MDB1961818.1 recombinase family protein [Clostridium tertium]MDB1966752.1 recombinase family protein [Clostridium tertium]
MFKVAVYIRVSTNKEEQRLSLQNQQELFVNYISSKGWSVYKFYVDVDSGTKGKRPELQNLINDAENKKFDIIISKELSRLARNSELSYRIKNTAENNNIHIVTLDGAINTLDGNRGMFGMYAWLYEQESQRTSERIKYSKASRCRRGLFNGAIAPYGYYIKNGSLYPRKDSTPDIVKRIFNEYISGSGFDAIARKLYEEGIPSPSQIAEKPNATEIWHGSGVRNILENPHYTGSLYQARSSIISVTSNKRSIANKDDFIVIENTHEALISKDDFELVQNLIQSRRRIRPKQNVHLFSNMLFCQDCGHGMHFKKNRRGYICGKYNKHGSKACSDHIVRESELSNFVLTEIVSVINKVKKDDLYSIIQEKLTKNTIVKKYEACVENLQSFKDKKSKALHMLVDEQITKEDYDIFITDIDNNIKTLMKESQEYTSALNGDLSHQILKELESIRTINLDLSELNRELVNRFITKIEISENGVAKIHFRLPQLSSL